MAKQSKHIHELNEFLGEAEAVKHMTEHQGWQILKRDIASYLSGAAEAWCNLDKNDQRFEELRTRTLACRMLLNMVEDYESNRLKAQEELLKELFPDDYVKADMDNLTPLKEEE